jgi:hypothetical protein
MDCYTFCTDAPLFFLVSLSLNNFKQKKTSALGKKMRGTSKSRNEEGWPKRKNNVLWKRRRIVRRELKKTAS